MKFISFFLYNLYFPNKTYDPVLNFYNDYDFSLQNADLDPTSVVYRHIRTKY